MAFLFLELIRIITNPIPHPNYTMISYNKTGWLLYDKKHQEIPVNTVRLVINTSLFILLELQIENRSKYITIFSDQITEDNSRLLNIVAKIS